MAQSRLDAARSKLINAIYSGKPDTAPGVHTATFQPLGATRNADRLVVEKWDILGQTWLFLAVCDGHCGGATSEYTAKTFPAQVRDRVERGVRELFGGRLDESNRDSCKPVLNAMLDNLITRFDKSIGRQVKELCRHPERLTEEDGRRLVRENEEVFERAFQGTTLTMALIHVDLRLMWCAGVGDSTIALSYTEKNGKRRVKRICDLHSFKNPQEYFRVVMERKYAEEKDVVDRQSDKVLGWLSVSRAIGDFPLKLDRAYTQHLFQYLPSKSGYPFRNLIERLKTPPYITAKPSVACITFPAIVGQGAMVLLFSDGVDHLVDGFYTFSPQVHSGADPLDVLSALLSDPVDPLAETTLGHPVEPGWSRADDNRAVDILGNLLGGASAERLEMVMDDGLLNATEGPVFQIDDVTIIAADLDEICT